MITNKLKTLVRRFGYDVGHFPDWRKVFKEVDLLIDVGANHGQTYEYFRSMGWKGLVISYEAWRPTFEKLTKKPGRDWHRRCACLGDTNETRPFYVQSNVGHDGCNSLLVKDRKESELITERVETKRLDDEMLPAGNILLKIDAEGCDMEVFRGAEGLWPRIKWVITEVSLINRFHTEPTLSAVVREMSAAGYEVSFIDKQYAQPHITGCEAMDVVFRKTL